MAEEKYRGREKPRARTRLLGCGAIKQSRLTPNVLKRWIGWMHRNRLTQGQAANAIGISGRMLSNYLSGARPIPKTVWLACKGWEPERAA